MMISAKVSSLTQAVSLSGERTLSGALQLTEGSNVALNISPDLIASYSREGSDLVIQMKDGQTFKITNFYAEGQPASKLYLVGTDNELILVELGPVASQGSLSVTYTPQEVSAGFESLTTASAGEGIFASTGLLAAGGLAVAVGAAAAGGGGGGGGGGGSDSPSAPTPPTPPGPPSPPSPPVPPTPPKAVPPSDLKLSSDGLSITGRATAGSTVEMDINGDGVVDYSALVDANGQFTIVVREPLNNGEQLQLRSRLPGGQLSEPATFSVPDTAAPLAPGNLQVSADGTQLSGTAEPGSKVSIDINADGQPDASVIAGAGGQFVFTLNPPLKNGENISVVAQDAAGNLSPSASVIARDTTAPLAPSVNTTDGSVFSGIAEPGSTVFIKDLGGTTLDQVQAGTNGAWQITLTPPLAHGAQVFVTAQDAAGNTSATTPLTLNLPPDNLRLSSDGMTLTGRSKPGGIVEIDINGDGVADYTTPVDANGRFSFTMSYPLNNGQQLQLATRVSPGVSSSRAMFQAPDDIAPLRPHSLQIAPDGSQLRGTAEPGSTVSIDTNGDGTADASVLVPANGQFVVAFNPPLNNGEVVTVIATDAAGNTSIRATLIAPDTTPPASPVLNPTNGQIITGTAEAGAAAVIVVIGSTAVTVPVSTNGNWSYTPSSPIADGTTVSATARDNAGNSSPPVSVNVTANLPNPPVVIVANGTEISGTGPIGSTIEVRDANGVLIAPVVLVGPDGTWSTMPGSLPGNTVITVTALNGGVASAPTTLPLDVTPPNVTITTHTATQLGGITEPGSSVRISDSNGLLGIVQADAHGNWKLLISPALADGVQVFVTGQDIAGNTSAPITATIDAFPPAAPVVTSSSDTAISGTAEAGTLLRLVDGNGRTLGQLTVGPSGTWSFTPTPPLAEGTQVTVTVRDSAGNTSPSTTIRIDSIAPDAAEIDASNGTVFTGTAEPGATVIITGPGGAPIGQADADINGNWSITPSPALTDGTQVSVVVRDPAGNTSTPVTATVDLTPPPPPVILPGNGSEVSGTAEPGSTVTITTGGTPLTAVADANGNWNVTANPALPNGTVITAIATDAAGNPSQPSTSVTTDNTLPDRPTIAPSNGVTLTGTGVFGESVILSDGNGNPIATALVASDNTWTYTLTTPLADGTQVVAVADDGSGNISAPAQVVVDAVPPPAAQIAPSNGSQLSGIAEANSTVLINGGGINTQVVAGPDGKWSYAGPGLPIADGTTVTVTVRDASGNTSSPSSVLIDAAPPGIPTIAFTNGTLLAGTAEPGTQLVLTTSNGPLATVNVDINGNWSYTPVPPLANNVQVNAVARDAVGNLSSGASTTVDANPPAAPVVSPSNGSVIRGTGEAGATITLTDASGNVIGTTQVLFNNSWSFTSSPALPDGTLVKATATDAAGNQGASTTITVDGIAPPAPVINTSTGTTLTGTAEPGTTIRLLDGNNGLIGTANVNLSGNWTFSVTPTPLPNGTVVNAVAIDAAGNISLQASTTTDNTAPAPATITVHTGNEITGTAEPDSTVQLALPSGAVVNVTVDGSGNWSWAPSPPLTNGAVVGVNVRDAAGNLAGPVNVTIDSVPPAPPVVDASNGTQLEGSTEVGSVILITIGNGTPILVTPAPDGTWSYSPTPPLAESDTVTVVARDAAGNVSTPTNPVIDTTPPDVTIEPSNGSVLTGITEAGASVAVSVDGSVVATVIAGADGRWTWSPAPGPNVPHNTAISVVATDAVGNISAPAAGTVDRQAPSVTIAPSNGQLLTGQTEALATVTITSGGVFIATVTANTDGIWAYTPIAPLAHNAPISVTAKDIAGNTSGTASTTIDAEAPPVPTIRPSNGSVIAGTAEPNSTVTLTLTEPGPGGAVTTIGPITVDNLGNWSHTASPTIAHDTTVTATASDAMGNTSPTSAGVVVDSVPPASPVVLPSDGTSITGTAEPGSTLTFKVGGVLLTLPNGDPLTVTANASGYWQLNGVGPFADEAVIEATATDATGNASLIPGTTTVDAALPPPPVINPSRGNNITGTAEPGTTVTLTIGAQVVSGIMVNGAGNWSYFASPSLGDGQQVTAVAVDGASNISSPATMVVDAMPPPIPDALTANANTVTGTGEAGTTILVRLGATVLGSTTVGADGKWTVNLSPAQPNGTLLTATASDALGNSSSFDVIRVDANPPPQPAIQLTNGTLISGTAENNSTVILSVGGVQIGTAQAIGGNWSFTASPPLADGVIVEVVARDHDGNVSPPATTIVDGTPPSAAVVKPSNGITVSGTAESGGMVTIFVNGAQVGTAPVDGAGNWTFTPSTRLPDGAKVEVRAQDSVGNVSTGTVVTVDGIAPAAPVITPTNGALIRGTAEPGSRVNVIDQNNQVVGSAIADGAGNWAFVPSVTPAHGITLSATAVDTAGNVSAVDTTTVDSLPPPAPTGQISGDGALLTGVAEANSTITLLVPGGLPPIVVRTDANGVFSVPLSPVLTAAQTVQIVASDAAGNTSPTGLAQAPNLAPPAIAVGEAADGYVNAAEISNGIQVQVGLQPGTRIGDSVTLTFRGQGGFTFTHTHVLTGTDIANGNFTATLTPPGGNGTYPQGASSVIAHVNNAADGPPFGFTVDTIPPQTPVLSLAGSLLTVSTDPGVEVTINVNVGGVTATVTVMANNAGIASLNLLTGLSVGLTWDQLISAQIGVTARDAAGNPSNVAQIGLGVGTNLQPVTVGNFAVDANLNPLAPKLDITGTTAANAGLVIAIITPLLNVTLSPMVANASGQFSLNLLSPSVLSQLGLTVGGLLNLGADLQIRITSTSQGKQSATYTVDLDPLGLLGLTIGAITVTGTAADDILSGTATSAEHLIGGLGNDLILNVGSYDRVDAGAGNDTIQITATNFTSIAGGQGFDTLLLGGGIDINFNTVALGSVTGIERLDLGTGDSGSTVTLTAAQITALTSSNNILQITGEANDALHVTGAVNTNTLTAIDGIRYQVWTLGATTLHIEENSVQVIVA